MQRVFYKTTYTLEVISEYSQPDNDIYLEELLYCVREGDWQASIAKLSSEELDPSQAAIELLRQGKQPTVMHLTVDGSNAPTYWKA